MLFNTLTYFWFICIVFSVYWFFLNKRIKLQNLFLLIASYCFYGWWDIRFLSLIFLSSTTDFFIGQAIQNQTAPSQRKLLLGIGLAFNLGGVSARLEQFKSNYIFREKFPEPDLNPYGYGDSNRLATADERLKNRQGWARWTKRRNAPEIEEIQLKYPYAYLLKTIKLLQNKKIPFIFIYLPESGSDFKKPLRFDFYQQYGQVLTLPDMILTNPDNWMDDMHFNDNGARLVSEWATQQLDKLLKTDKNCIQENKN